MNNNINVFLTDLHFGYKHFSNVWFNEQIKFIDTQLYDFCNEKSYKNYKVNLFILGDVFDNRKIIDINIVNKVKKSFLRLSKINNISIYIICGNHDLYDNNKENLDINIYNALEFNSIASNIDVIIKDIYQFLLGNNLYCLVPWFNTIDKESILDTIHHIVNIYPSNGILKYMLCHTTLPNCGIDSPFDDEILMLLKEHNITVISGHIHIPNLQKNIRCYNLGSCYPLTFQDANQKRGFYYQEPYGQLTFIENNISKKFWRFYTKESFIEADKNILEKDFIELYLSSKYFEDTEFIDILKELCTKNSNITVYNIPEEIENLIEDTPDIQFDMQKYIDEYIPEHLKEKYNLIKSDVCKENKDNEL